MPTDLKTLEKAVLRRPCLVQFVWPQDDEGDYLAFRPMSEIEEQEVKDLLTQAEAQSIIRPGWYVGTLVLDSTQAHKAFVAELRDTLNLEEEDHDGTPVPVS